MKVFLTLNRHPYYILIIIITILYKATENHQKNDYCTIINYLKTEAFRRNHFERLFLTEEASAVTIHESIKPS